ncbi:MAG: type II 3-dehydroquinate dehydratase [Acidimicrobiia bacterium]
MATILLLSGPNLNLFGSRDPEVYGTDTLDEMVDDARRAAGEHGLDLEHLQSNYEGAIVDAIQAARGRCDAIILNAGALTHYSFAISDALAAYDGVKVELHVSNPAAREEWRHTSMIAGVVDGTVAGFGRAGYRLAVEAVAAKLRTRTDR